MSAKECMGSQPGPVTGKGHLTLLAIIFNFSKKPIYILS